MTALRTRLGAPVPENMAHEYGHPGVHDIIVRLRDAAGEMVAFSRTKTLIREAAATIERLDGDARHQSVEIARLTAELALLRPAHRSA